MAPSMYMTDEAREMVEQAYAEVTKEFLIRVSLERWLRQNYGWQALDRWWSQKDAYVAEMKEELHCDE